MDRFFRPGPCRRAWGIVAAGFLVLAVASPGVAQSDAPKAPAGSQALRTDMIRLFSALTSVLPLSLDKFRFADQSNDARIKKALSEMQQLSHKVSGRRATLPVDPISRLVVRNLDADLASAVKLFSEGEKEYARYLVRDITSHCIACHTSSPRGKRNFPSNALGEMLTGMTAFEKANFFAATRQYPEAAAQYEAYLLDQGEIQSSHDNWGIALKRLMAILVRVRNEPFQALELIARLREGADFPRSFLATSTQWRKSIRVWREEQGSGRRGKSREAGSLEKASKLLAQAEDHESKIGPDAGLIEFLRASRMVNDLLSGKAYKGEEYAKLLHMGGKISEAIYEINFGTLENLYYEACIRQSPHTSTAGQCLDRYRQVSILRAGKGEQILSDLQKKKLEELTKLAEEKR